MGKFIIFFSTVLLLTSCTAKIPEPIGYPYTQQQKMQASQHWQLLAYDLANRINNQLILSDNIHQAVFIQETCGDESKPCEPGEVSPFKEAFRDLLLTAMVDYGVPVSAQVDEKQIVINYKVQVVRHDATRFRTLQPGLLTALSAAVVVLRNAPTELLILATGVGADLANTSLSLHSSHEVIITTSIINKEKYLFRSSDIYYISDRDSWHYRDNIPEASTIKLTGSRVPVPAE